MLASLRNKLTYSFVLSVLAGCTTTAATTAGSGASVSSCGGSLGGLNENQKAPGDQPGGVAVNMGDIAVAPGGDYVVFKKGEQLAVGWPATGVVMDLPVTWPTRLAFAKTRPVIYVGSLKDGKIHAVNVKSQAELWAAPITDANQMLIASSNDDTRIVASSSSDVVLLRTTDGQQIGAMDTNGQRVADIEILDDNARALIVPTETWEANAPSTHITVLNIKTGSKTGFDVPNCADNIIVTNGGTRAFLAPTTCVQDTGNGHDPISYLDLAVDNEHFVKNLPGFGPIALGPDGHTAVGFLDGELIDETLFDDPAQIPAFDPENRFFLMVLDTDSLTYDFYPVGNNLPRYAMTQDGSVLLVDSWPSETVRLFDPQTGEFRSVSGPGLLLDNFVLTSDSLHAYVIQSSFYGSTPSGLYDLDIEQALSSQIFIDFVPMNINIAPDDRTLYLRINESKVCIFSLEMQSCTSFFDVGVGSL